MLDRDIHKLIAERDKIVEDIEQLIRHKNGLDNNDVQSIAEILHHYSCKQTHDGTSCAWWFTEWNNNPRKDYVAKAKMILDLSSKNNIKPSVLVDIVGILVNHF
jgi:hypothetical protein